LKIYNITTKKKSF